MLNLSFCYIDRMFAGTRSAAEDPLRAARVYDDIAEAIAEAERAAEKANIDANNATEVVSHDLLKPLVLS